MKVIKFLIAPDSVHVCVESFAWLKVIFFESHTFPFCKRMYNFYCLSRNSGNIKLYRSFNSIQVIIKTTALLNKKRC